MPIATGTRERCGRVRLWVHRVLGALGWVALVLLAVWRLPEVARTVACSIVLDDRRGDIERTRPTKPSANGRLTNASDDTGTRPPASERGQLATNSGLILLWNPARLFFRWCCMALIASGVVSVSHSRCLRAGA